MPMPKPKAPWFIIESPSKGGYSSVKVAPAEAYFWLIVTCLEAQHLGDSKRKIYAVKTVWVGKDSATSCTPVLGPSDIYHV